MTDDLSWVPPDVDTKRANVARVYDYGLGGSHNFLAEEPGKFWGLVGVGRKLS
jgi:S-adenosyl methyltransferase